MRLSFAPRFGASAGSRCVGRVGEPDEAGLGGTLDCLGDLITRFMHEEVEFRMVGLGLHRVL